MILEMKIPSPGESITEVEIAQWLVSDGDYVEKDQTIAEVDSDKATLDLPAEVSGTITLEAEEGDAVAVGAIVCLIDTEGTLSEGSSTPSKEVVPQKTTTAPLQTETQAQTTYASQTPSPAAKKILDENGITAQAIIGTGKDNIS